MTCENYNINYYHAKWLKLKRSVPVCSVHCQESTNLDDIVLYRCPFADTKRKLFNDKWAEDLCKYYRRLENG